MLNGDGVRRGSTSALVVHRAVPERARRDLLVAKLNP
jgi:hypothetical protein